MSNLRKIIVSLPEPLLEQIDAQSEAEGKNRSVVVRDALTLYLMEQKKARIKGQMKQGYQEMGLLNLQLAEEGVEADMRNLNAYEKKLK